MPRSRWRRSNAKRTSTSSCSTCRTGADAGAAPVPVARGLRSPADVGLTGRQAEILARLMRGEANKVIGRELGLAESTVKNQITAILKALEVSSRTQAVLAVERLGLALPEPGATRR